MGLVLSMICFSPIVFNSENKQFIIAKLSRGIGTGPVCPAKALPPLLNLIFLVKSVISG